MTKKDYILIAEVLKNSYLYLAINPKDSVSFYKMIVRRMSSALDSNNSRFDWDKFYIACGLTIEDETTGMEQGR